jgi:hypothetical protein
VRDRGSRGRAGARRALPYGGDAGGVGVVGEHVLGTAGAGDRDVGGSVAVELLGADPHGRDLPGGQIAECACRQSRSARCDVGRNAVRPLWAGVIAGLGVRGVIDEPQHLVEPGDFDDPVHGRRRPHERQVETFSLCRASSASTRRPRESMNHQSAHHTSVPASPPSRTRQPAIPNNRSGPSLLNTSTPAPTRE